MCFIKPTYTYLHGARLMVMSAWCTLYPTHFTPLYSLHMYSI